MKAVKEETTEWGAILLGLFMGIVLSLFVLKICTDIYKIDTLPIHEVAIKEKLTLSAATKITAFKDSCLNNVNNVKAYERYRDSANHYVTTYNFINNSK